MGATLGRLRAGIHSATRSDRSRAVRLERRRFSACLISQRLRARAFSAGSSNFLRSIQENCNGRAYSVIAGRHGPRAKATPKSRIVFGAAVAAHLSVYRGEQPNQVPPEGCATCASFFSFAATVRLAPRRRGNVAALRTKTERASRGSATIFFRECCSGHPRTHKRPLFLPLGRFSPLPQRTNR
jgi:hypothetical protein